MGGVVTFNLLFTDSPSETIENIIVFLLGVIALSISFLRILLLKRGEEREDYMPSGKSFNLLFTDSPSETGNNHDNDFEDWWNFQSPFYGFSF